VAEVVEAAVEAAVVEEVAEAAVPRVDNLLRQSLPPHQMETMGEA
jgi:hypothetical protein